MIPGRRHDLETVANEIANGASVRSFATSAPVIFTRYHKGLTALSLAVSRPRKFKTKVTVIFGETGVGKSRWACETYPDAYWKPPNSKWWDNYAQEETVIIDEFYGRLPYRDWEPLERRIENIGLMMAEANVMWLKQQQ